MKRIGKTMDNLTIVTSFSERYYNAVGQYTLPTWSHLNAKKIVLCDRDFVPEGYSDIEFISSSVAYLPNDPYLNSKGKKLKFWRKGMCVAWAAKNVTTDYMLWLDSDVKVFADLPYDQLLPDENTLSTLICADNLHAETGFVLINRTHPEFEKWVKEYRNAWYDGTIETLYAPWDGFVYWETMKNRPHVNLARKTNRSAQGFEDTMLTEFMFHYSGAGRKHLVKGEEQ